MEVEEAVLRCACCAPAPTPSAMGQQTRVAADRYWSATARAASLCHPLGSQAIQGGQELLLRGLGEERRGRGATGGGVTAARRVAPRLLPW